MKFLKDSSAVRWSMLALVALTMFAAYLATDLFAPLKTLLQENNHWNSTEYGWYSGAYAMFNVFLGMLIFGGLILDKMGIRFTGVLSCSLMIFGVGLKYWALTTPELIETTTVLFGTTYKMQVIWAALGYAIFGVGSEIAGITVTKVIAKWFSGKDLALAMGLQLALARLGSAAALYFSPKIVDKFGTISSCLTICLILLFAGFACYLIYIGYDKKLDKQLVAAGENTGGKLDQDEEFHISDILNIVKNPAFWMIAFLCVLFYSAVFPFLKYGSELMIYKFGVEPKVAGDIPSMLPLGCIILTPLFGWIYDEKGHGVDLMIIGAALISVVHLLFAVPFVTEPWMAKMLMIMLGVGFAMLPSAMWPSIAKIMPLKQLGTTMSLTFFIQNIGLWGVPLLIGTVLDKYCKTTIEGVEGYNYTIPMLIFASFGIISILISLGLKVLDKKKGYNLQISNKR